MGSKPISLEQKVLQVNLDSTKYGTLAEIGAGQEVARWFFLTGGASGTVAKTISAYDMKFSDAIYGSSHRYVSKERAVTMLEYEFSLLQERLSDTRGDKTTFFVFADTVAARSYTRQEDGIGWLGIRFQDHPKAVPSQILVHVRLLDKENVLQQEAIGILGVNLIYGALFLYGDLSTLIQSLGDHLAPGRLDLNLIEFSGPGFPGVDNRLMNLKLIQKELTRAVMFDAHGNIVEPGEILYKKPILVQRGTFRPVTLVHQNMLASAMEQFSNKADLKEDDIVSLMEITTSNLLATAAYEPADYLSRLDTLATLEKPVLISSFSEFYQLEAYLNRYSDQDIVFAVGVRVLAEIFNEKYYQNLDGGILESLGRLFKNKVKLYIYPTRDPETEQILTATGLKIADHLRHLYAHLLENGYIQPIDDFHEDLFRIVSTDVLAGIQSGEEHWESMVPGVVVHLIKDRGLFGYHTVR